MRICFICTIFCFLVACQSYSIEQHKAISLLQEQDVRAYLAVSQQFALKDTTAIKLLKQSKRVDSLLHANGSYELLIEDYPSGESPIFTVSLREMDEVRASRIASFLVNAVDSSILVKTEIFSEAYNEGIFSVPLSAWETNPTYITQ